jgi:hypothetical protein
VHKNVGKTYNGASQKKVVNAENVLWRDSPWKINDFFYLDNYAQRMSKKLGAPWKKI